MIISIKIGEQHLNLHSDRLTITAGQAAPFGREVGSAPVGPKGHDWLSSALIHTHAEQVGDGRAKYPHEEFADKTPTRIRNRRTAPVESAD